MCFDTSIHSLYACVHIGLLIQSSVPTLCRVLAELITGEGRVWAAVTCPPSFLLPSLSLHLTAVSCHSLMDAPGANNSSLQPFITVTSLSEPSRSNLLHCRSPVTLSLTHICVTERARSKQRVCLKKKKKTREGVKERKRQRDREEEGREIINRQESCHVNRCSLFSVLD